MYAYVYSYDICILGAASSRQPVALFEGLQRFPPRKHFIILVVTVARWRFPPLLKDIQIGSSPPGRDRNNKCCKPPPRKKM